MKTNIRTLHCFVDIGSHGGIFEFEDGMVAKRYPSLLQVYHRRIRTDLIPAIITYELPDNQVKE